MESSLGYQLHTEWLLNSRLPMNHEFFKERKNYDNQKPYQRRNFGTDQVSGTKHLKRVCFLPYKQVEQASYVKSKLALCKLRNIATIEEQKAGTACKYADAGRQM